MMKEKLKKYKHTTLGLEGELVKRNNQIVVQEGTISTLKAQLQVSAWGCGTVVPCGAYRYSALL